MPVDISRIYVFVRTDLPLAQQIVQAGHACLDAGARFGLPPYHHLVLCGIEDGPALHDVAYHLDRLGVSHVMFYEPDLVHGADVGQPAGGHTALCTEAVTDPAIRRHLRRFPLWHATQ